MTCMLVLLLARTQPKVAVAGGSRPWRGRFWRKPARWRRRAAEVEPGRSRRRKPEMATEAVAAGLGRSGGAAGGGQRRELDVGERPQKLDGDAMPTWTRCRVAGRSRRWPWRAEPEVRRSWART
jgi:hypothetical protein